MIQLKVETYCENCKDFEADVSKSVLYNDDVMLYETYIRCENAGHCKQLYEYLKGEINGKS